MEPWQLTIAEAISALRDKVFSSRELVESCLKRIDAVEPSVLAWARLRPERALAEADAFDRLPSDARSRLPLGGIPVGAKDVIASHDLETTGGSKLLEGWLPSKDAAALARLRSAGAILLGKTHTTEFAWADPAPTRNPANILHTPGGSSSGSGAAVGSGMCFAALGTQTSGSILRPAAYCGAVGYKPSYEAVSRDGVLPLAWSLDHVGPIAKTAHDARLVFEAIATNPSSVATRVPKVIGLPDRYFTDADSEVQKAVSDTCTVLAAHGWQLKPVKLPDSFDLARSTALVILATEVASAHEDDFARRPEAYRPKLREIIEIGQCVRAGSYLRAQRIRRVITNDMATLFNEIDLLLTPAIPAAAPEGLASTGDPRFLAPFSLCGFPAISMPVARNAAGLPIAMQIVGPFGCDLALLGACETIEGQVSELFGSARGTFESRR